MQTMDKCLMFCIFQMVGNAEISARCTIEVRDNEIVALTATYKTPLDPVTSSIPLVNLASYISVRGINADGTQTSTISNWTLEGDLAASRYNTEATYDKVVKVIYGENNFVKPAEVTITNIQRVLPARISYSTGDRSYGAGTAFDPAATNLTFAIAYEDFGSVTLAYANDDRFSYSYTDENGNPIKDENGEIKEGMEDHADKAAFEYYSTTNNTDYLYIYYTESSKTISIRLSVTVFKSAHSIVILNSDGTTYRPGQETSGLTYEYEVTDDNAATGKAHSFDLDNTGYEFDPEIMKISVKGNRDGGEAEAINSGIVIETAASKQTGEVRLTEAGTYTVTVALTNPGYYWSGYEESVSELSFTVEIDKADLKDLSVSVGHTTYDDSEQEEKPGWTYGDDFQEGWVTYKGNYGGGDVEWHYSGTLNAGTDYSDNVQAPTDAGSYKVYVDISETDNFKAGSTKGAPAEFIVGKKEIEPTLKDSGRNILQIKTYEGTPLTADAVADGRYSILTNAQNAQNVGTYPVTLTLTDKYNYRWDKPMDDVANREVLFEIVAKQVARPQSAFTNTYDGNEQTIDLNLGGTIGERSTDAFQAPVKGTATRHSGIGSETPVLDWSISGDTVSATSAAVYTVTVKLNNTVSNGDGEYINYVWSDDQSHGDIVVTWTIKKAHNPISVTMDDWTYGQTAKEPLATATFGLEGAKYEFYKDEACSTPAVGDDASQKPTAAGTYWVKATIFATGDYGDGSQGFTASVAKDSFTIERATLALPEIAGDEAYYTYSGDRIDVKINASYLNDGIDVAITSADQFNEYFTFSGDLYGTDARDYALTVTLNSNYQWESGTGPVDLAWSILRAKIAKPTVTGDTAYYTYKEDAINIQILAEYLGEGAITVTSLTQFEEYFTFTGQFSETNANSYALTVSLNSNYQWSDNGDAPLADITLNWSIEQGVNEVTSLAIANRENWTYDDGSDHTLSYSFKFNKEAEITVTYYRGDDSLGREQPTDAGSYRVVVSVAETGNYKGASKELSFTIARKTVALPEVDYSAGAGTVGGTQGYTYADGETIFVVVRSDELGSVKVKDAQSLAPYFTFSQNNSGVNAGGYTLSVTPTANYAWKDGTFEAKDIGWNIVARVIELPTFDNGTEKKESDYSRGEQSAEIVTYDEKAMIVAVSERNSANESGRFDKGTKKVYATHADVYTVTVTLNNQGVTNNYVWNADGTDTAEKPLYWTISPEVIYAPSFAGAAEDGKLTTEFKDTLSGATGSWVATPEQQTAAVNGYDDSAMSFVVSGEGSYSGGSVFATNAGVYTVTVTLKNSADIPNFVWAEGVGSDGTVTLTWEITPKAVGIDVAQTNTERRVTYQSDAPSQTITAIDEYVTNGQGSAYFVFNENKYYQYQGGSYAVCSEPQGYGDYYFYIDLKDTNNYKWSDASVSGGEAHLNDSLIDGSGVTKRFWFQIAKADYTVEVTFEGGTEPYIYGTVPSVKYAISGENGEVQKAIEKGKITVSIYYLGIEGTVYGADQNDGVGSTDIPQDVGKYRVVVYIPEVEGGNYRAMYVGLDDEYTFEITPKKLTVKFTGDAFNDGYSFVYGKAADASVSVDGYEYSDSEKTSPVTLTYNGEEDFPTNVGNYTVVASVGNLNYYIEDGSAGEKLQSTSAGYNVTPADLTVMVEGQNITYGDPRGKWVLSATGWVTVYSNEQALYQADFLEAVKDAVSCDYKQGSNVGKYPITLNAPANIGDWAKNYSIVYDDTGKQVSVSQRKLIVVITDGQESYTYGDVIEHGYEFVNLYKVDEVTVTLTYTGTGNYNDTIAPKNVGSYSVTATISGNKNYVLDTQNTESVQFTIGQRNLTIVIADKTTIYGEAAPDWTIEEYRNIVTGDEALLKGLVEEQGNFSCAYVAGKSGVNTYPVTLTEKALAAIRAGAGNYKIIVDEGALTVARRQITVEIADKTSIYGGEIVELTASVDTTGGGYGLVGDDPDPWTLSAENISVTSDAGTYTISGKATDGNYSVQFKTGTYTITPRQVEIDFTLRGDEGGFTVTYSGKPQKMTAEVSGTVNGDVITAEVTYNTDDESAPVNVNADGYTAKATLSGKKANNYYVTSTGSGTAEDEYVYLRYAEQDFTIAKAKLTVETYETDGTVVYGDEAVFGYNITGFVKDETESVLEGTIAYTTNYAPGAASDAAGGAYTVSYTEGSFTSGNYEISAAAETSFQVTAREVTLDLGSLIAESFVYGEAAGASAGINETLPDSIKGDDLRFSYTYAGRDDTERDEADDTEEYPTFAGKYTVTVTIGNQNYELTGTNSKGYEITQKLVHVKADDKEITYGDPVPDDYTISYTQADFVYGETAETAGIDESGLAFNCSYRQGDDATTYSITASGLTSRNYAFTYEEGTLTVGKRTITVILSDAESTYGDARDLYEQARVTAGSLYAGGTGGENTEDTAKEVYGFTVYRYDAETTEYLPFERDFGSAETGAGTYYFVLVNNMPNNYVITVEGGYTVKDEEAGRHVIDPKSLQVDITGNNSVTYDGNSHAITAKIKTEEGVDDVSMLSYYTGKDGTVYDSDTAPTNAGVYTVTFKSSNENYTSAEISATLTISPRTIDIVWNGGETDTYTYDNKPKTVTAAYHPYVNGEMAEGQSIALTAEVTSYEAYTLQGGFAAASGAREFKDAGKYTFTVSFAETDPNYVLPAVNTRKFTIERAAITVYIDDKTSEYGDDLAALTYRIEGDIYDAAETVFTLSTTATRLSNVGGNYEISGTVNEARGLNYIVAFYRNYESSSRNTAVYTIAPRVLIVTAEYGEGSIVYGEEIDTDLFSLTYKRKNTQYGEETFVNGDQASSVTVLPAAFGTSYRAGVTPAGSTVTVAIDTAYITFENYKFVDSKESDFDVEQREITLRGDYEAQFADLTYNGADRWLEVITEDVENLARGETVGEDVSFDYSFTFNGSSQAEQKAIGAGEYVVTISLNEEASPNYAFDTDTVEFTIAKKALTITPDFDPATAETQNITVRYGNVLTSDYIRENYIRYDGFIDGESEQPESTDILSHIVVEQGYVYADADTRTDAGTKLPVTLRFEEDFAPDNYEVTFGQDTQIEVLKRQINIELTNEYEQNSYGYHVFGEYGKEIKPVIAQVSSGGIVEGDTESAEIAYTYYYYGVSNDGTWNYLAQEAQEQGISTPPDKAGTYGVIVVLASGNYELAPEDTGISEDRTTRTFENYYTILKQRVDSPKWAYSSLTATGGEQENTLEYNVSLYSYVTADSDNGNMPTVINSSNGTITMRATYAGNYWVIFELNDPNNYVWRELTGTEEGYDDPLINIEWSISNYNDLTVTILGLDTNGDGSADLTPTAGEDGALWLNGTWAYGDAFGTMIAEGKYNGGQNTFEGTISIRFYLASSSEQVTNYRNAGTYYAVASVMASSDYNAAESERVYFTISRKALTVPTAESKEYSGVAVEALLADFNGATMNIVGIAQGLTYTLRDGAYYLSAVNADTYYLNIALSDPNNYIWSGQSGSAQTVEVRWTVTPKTVQAPELAEMSKTYTGETFSYEVAQSEYYIVRGTTSATDAGAYTVTVALRSTTNYVWSTSGTANLSVTWYITKAENGWKEGQDTYSREGWTYGSAAAEETVPVPEFGSVSVKYYTDASLQNEFAGAFDEQTNAGTYYVLIAVEGNDNYSGLTLGEGGTLSFTVEKASNNWIGSYAREGWTYGSDPSEETLPDADFGTVTVRYYTDASHEHEYTQGFTRTTDAGVYYVTLTVEGNNNYDGLTAQAQFEIGKATAYVVWSGGSFTYDSTDQTAKITAQFYESVATAGGYLDIAVSIQSYNGEEAADQFKEFKDAGTYVFAASLAGTDYEKNYELSGQTHKYVMQRASVTVTLSAQETVYSGQTPEIDQEAYEVTAGSAFGEDLGIELSVEGEFVNAGTYNIEAAYSNDTNFEVTFIGAQFVISPLEIRVEITPNGGSYGNVTEAEARVTNAGGEPVSGVQVTLTYTGTMNNGEQYTGTEAPAEAGSYIVTATVESTNYNLMAAEPVSFIVSKARVSVGAIGSKAYNGESQTAEISVTGAEEDVYELINAGGKNVGNYEVCFTFKGDNAYNYVWFYNDTEVNGASLELTFSITVLRAAENPVSIDISGLDGWTYGDAAKTPSAEAKVYGEPVFYYAETENGTYTTAVPVHAGTYWVKAVVEATTNNEASSSEAKQFTVAQAANGWLDGQDTYSRDGWTYGDEATEETLPVPEFGSASVAYYTDSAHTKPYTGSFDSRTNAGIYYVVITVEGSDNYSGITLNGQFEVEKRSLALPDLADTADTAVETGDTLHNEIVGFDSSTMNMSELGSGITTIDGKLYLAAKDAGVYQITISLADTSNYQWTDGKDGDVTLVWTLRRAELESWTEESESRYPDVVVSADGGIHPLYTLEISSILEESYGDYDLSAYENAEIALGYDIGFTSGGEAVQPESAVTVRLKVTDEIASALGEGYTLLHLHGGEWSEVSYTVEDGYAVFTVTEFSAFLFITETPATSLVWLIIVLAVLLTVEIVLLVVAIVKRRKGRN